MPTVYSCKGSRLLERAGGVIVGGRDHVVARVGRNGHPASLEPFGDRERVAGHAADHVPAGLPVEVVRRRIFVGPAPRVGHALRHGRLIPVIASVGHGLERGAGVQSGTAGVQDGHGIQRRDALGQNAAGLGGMGVVTGHAVSGRGHHAQILARMLVLDGVGVAGRDFREGTVGGRGHLPREVDLVAAVEVGRRVPVQIVGSGGYRVADVGAGHAFVFVSEIGSVVGEHHMVEHDLVGGDDGTRRVAFVRARTVEHSAGSVQLLPVARDLHADVLARKFFCERFRDGQGLAGLAVDGPVFGIGRVAAVPGQPLVGPTALGDDALARRGLAVVGVGTEALPRVERSGLDARIGGIVAGGILDEDVGVLVQGGLGGNSLLDEADAVELAGRPVGLARPRHRDSVAGGYLDEQIRAGHLVRQGQGRAVLAFDQVGGSEGARATRGRRVPVVRPRAIVAHLRRAGFPGARIQGGSRILESGRNLRARRGRRGRDRGEAACRERRGGTTREGRCVLGDDRVERPRVFGRCRRTFPPVGDVGSARSLAGAACGLGAGHASSRNASGRALVCRRGHRVERPIRRRIRGRVVGSGDRPPGQPAARRRARRAQGRRRPQRRRPRQTPPKRRSAPRTERARR